MADFRGPTKVVISGSRLTGVLFRRLDSWTWRNAALYDSPSLVFQLQVTLDHCQLAGPHSTRELQRALRTASATRAASTEAFTSCVRRMCAPLRISAVCAARFP